MSNRVTLDALKSMKPAEMSALPIDQLAMLQDDLDELKLDVKAKATALALALEGKFGVDAAALRRASGKDTGTVTIKRDGAAIKADIPKKVEWDQAAMKQAVAIIRGWGENPDDYVVTEHKVPEATFNAWPPVIRKEFEPARTVKPGTQTFKIELKG